LLSRQDHLSHFHHVPPPFPQLTVTVQLSWHDVSQKKGFFLFVVNFMFGGSQDLQALVVHPAMGFQVIPMSPQ
jgi:hypothetical protein